MSLSSNNSLQNFQNCCVYKDSIIVTSHILIIQCFQLALVIHPPLGKSWVFPWLKRTSIILRKIFIHYIYVGRNFSVLDFHVSYHMEISYILDNRYVMDRTLLYWTVFIFWMGSSYAESKLCILHRILHVRTLVYCLKASVNEQSCRALIFVIYMHRTEPLYFL